MDRDSFIITVYCLVIEHYQLVNEKFFIRRGGFAPALTDEEVRSDGNLRRVFQTPSG